MLVAQTTQLALQVDGHKITIASDGAEALRLFSPGEFDLIVTDFVMPNVDGMELAESIKKVAPQVPVILMTSYADKVGGTLGQVSNVDVLLSKPVPVARLLEAVRTAGL